MKMLHSWSGVVVLLVLVSSQLAAAPPAELARGLQLPWGLAIQPETGNPVLVESGSGRVLRFVDGKLEEVAVGFPRTVFAGKPEWPFGPTGCHFLNRDLLLVGGVRPDGQGTAVFLVQVPERGQPPRSFDTIPEIGDLPSTPAPDTAPALLSFLSVKDTIYFADSARSGNEAIREIRVKSPDLLAEPNNYRRVKRFPLQLPASTRVLEQPLGFAASPRGELVLGFAGTREQADDSTLLFVRLTDGKPLLELPTSLRDLVAIAFNQATAPPDRAQLYALDLSLAEVSHAGLYRLDATLVSGRPAVNCVRIAEMAHPTSMAFDNDGQLYVTVIGADHSGDNPAGQLLRFSGGL